MPQETYTALSEHRDAGVDELFSARPQSCSAAATTPRPLPCLKRCLHTSCLQCFEVRGFLQSHRYLDRALATRLFAPRAEHQAEADKVLAHARRASPGAPLACLHLRVGDKLAKREKYPTLNMSFYHEAVGRIRSVLGRNVSLLGFAGGAASTNRSQTLRTSNAHDIDHAARLARRLLRGLGGRLQWAPEPSNAIVDLWAMRRCDALVVGLSSFSWWSAFLSESRLLFAPQQIYQPHSAPGRRYRSEDFYPPWWTVL